MAATETDDPTAKRPLTGERFLRPLEFVLAEHQRQCRVGDWLQGFVDDAEASLATVQATSLLGYLTEDLPAHTLDEELDLFPMLLRRCRPEDRVPEVLAQLSWEHKLDKDLVDFVVADLRRLADGFSLANPTRFLSNLPGFVETQRRHLEWENRVVLPLAQKRLSAEDLEQMGCNMAARRGLSYPD
jgi:hypothetical protein